MNATRHAPEMMQTADYFVGRFRAMASPCEILVHTINAGEAGRIASLCAQEAWRIEDKFSRYIPGNIIDRINSSAGGAVTVDDETAGLINFAFTLFELSEGRFDISSGILRKAWVFDGSDRLPDEQQVAQLLNATGLDKASWKKPQLQLTPDMQLDFGGIGKEYAVDRAAGIAAAHTKAGCLINFGGDLCISRPRSDQGAWHVGVEGSRIELKLSQGALATSGDANRFLLKDGVRYSHILNPKTGWPIEHAPHSVTVLADSCTQAGMLATLAMLQGADAETFLNNENVKHWCLR